MNRPSRRAAGPLPRTSRLRIGRGPVTFPAAGRVLQSDDGVGSPRIWTTAYAEALRADCARALAEGAIDSGNAGFYDPRVDAALGQDVARLRNELSLWQGRKERVADLWARRAARHRARADHLREQLAEVTRNLAEIDQLLAERRDLPRLASQLPAHTETARNSR